MSLEAPGLYLHLPFCSAICPYCDFSVLVGSRETRRRFVETLTAELELVDEEWAPFETVYLGGGTPSLAGADDLGRLLEAVRTRFEVQEAAGLSLEANPEDVTAEELARWRALGVTTVSLGVQSFDEESLRFLGRRHDPGQARSAVSQALDAGLDTVSVDLIFGLPDQSAASWRRDLEAALELRPDHISCYQLTVHRGTGFGARRDRGELVELAESSQAELFLLTHEVLGAAGYSAYEVSNFARAPEHRSRHNTKYWRRAPYLGLGPSAHSFDGETRRWWNERGLGAWEREVWAGRRPVASEETLSLSDRVLEILMLGLRTVDGVDLGELRRRFGVDLVAANRELLARHEAGGLLLREGDRLRPTLTGLAVADGLAAGFFLPEPKAQAASSPR